MLSRTCRSRNILPPVISATKSSSRDGWTETNVPVDASLRALGTYARTERWAETLIFLLELLSDHSGWIREILARSASRTSSPASISVHFLRKFLSIRT